MGRESGTSTLYFFLKSIRVSSNRLPANAAQKEFPYILAKKSYLIQRCVRCAGHLQIDGRLAYLVGMTNTYTIKQF
jgi:hypothetical protein